MRKLYTRREMLQRTGQALAFAATTNPIPEFREKNPVLAGGFGAIENEPVGAAVGRRVLEQGGNAIDAMAAAALATCIASPTQCGIGGYGGHMTIGIAGGKNIASIDFDTAAPAAARPDMFPLDKTGEVIGRKNYHGWLAAGVPGTLAGIQLALDRFGTMSFRDVVQPAIRLCRDGVVISAFLARGIRGATPMFKKDPGSAKVYLENGDPKKEGELLRNPELADMLQTLADRNSADSFYRGDIAQRLADAFQKNGGLVTAKDLANYHAREVRPLRFSLKDFDVYTAPLTAGGLSVVEAMQVLKQLGWRLESSGENLQARIEAMRYAWKDRLELLGDPEFAHVPVKRLLSSGYARDIAEKVRAAVKARRAAEIKIDQGEDAGTNNISCVDRHGNLVAATFTHGSTFGAQVTADGLGVTLGHGMWRFTPRPGHPNAPGPGKRPLDNMCPTVVARKGIPVLAVGGAGGLRIPNTIYDVLVNYVFGESSMRQAIFAPRLDCPGTLDVGLDGDWPESQKDYLAKAGFRLKPYKSAYATAVSFNPRNGACDAASH